MVALVMVALEKVIGLLVVLQFFGVPLFFGGNPLLFDVTSTIEVVLKGSFVSNSLLKRSFKPNSLLKSSFEWIPLLKGAMATGDVRLSLSKVASLSKDSRKSAMYPVLLLRAMLHTWSGWWEEK